MKPFSLNISPLVSSPLPIDLDLVKLHCGVDGTDLDTLLERYTLAAIRWAESALKRTLYQRAHVWTLPAFPVHPCAQIRLPRGKTVSVESITYQSAGEAVELSGPSSSPAGTGWREDLAPDSGGIIAPAYGATWPVADTDAPAPVVIEFVAGYPAGEIPADITHAILFAVKDMLDTRGSDDLTTFGKNLTTRVSLLSPYVLNRLH